jgi:hypothetical protein
VTKFIAFMRDSYREALSGWVLQVMLVFAVLLILFVASVSFRPISLKDELDKQFSITNWVLARNPDPAVRGTQYVIENYKESNPAEPWKSDYSFDLVIRAGSADALNKVRDMGLPVRRRQVEQMMSDALRFLDNVELREAPLGEAGPVHMALGGAALAPTRPGDPPGEVRYTITSRGTKAEDALAWRHEPAILFAIDLPFFIMSLREGIYTLQKRLVNDAGAWITLLVSIVITAAFVPNMIRRGAFDLYISKPISRPLLLVYKYLGGLLYVLILTSVTVGGVWVAIGLRTGIWSPHFLALIPLLTFYFAILYSVSTLVAVLTRSTLAAIIATVFAWGVFFVAGWAHDQVQQIKKAQAEMQQKLEQAVPKTKADGDEDDAPAPLPRAVPQWLETTTRIAHAVLPRTYDLDDRAIRLIAEGVLTEEERKQKNLDQELVPWPETIGVSGAFIALMLALASWRLVTRDG